MGRWQFSATAVLGEGPGGRPRGPTQLEEIAPNRFKMGALPPGSGRPPDAPWGRTCPSVERWFSA
jgi:hypothetical protein